MCHQQELSSLQDFLSAVLPNLGLELTFQVTAESAPGSSTMHVEFGGPDINRLVADRGAVLLALEHLAAMSLRLQPGQHDKLNFDAAGFKTETSRKIQAEVEMALAKIHSSEPVYHCAPMSYRER